MTGTQILKEIQQLGYKGGRSIFMNWVKKTLRGAGHRKTHSCASQPTNKTVQTAPDHLTPVIPWSSRRASWLLVKPEADISKKEKTVLDRMQQTSQQVKNAYDLAQRFSQMVRNRQPQALKPWLQEVKESGISALNRFANGIQRDLLAVKNALSLPWSQGQTEGQVNRLKLIKRTMYGRANFDLLRKRVLGSKHPVDRYQFT